MDQPRGTVVDILPESRGGTTPVAQLGVIHSGTDRSGYEIDVIGEEGWVARVVEVKRTALRLQRPDRQILDSADDPKSACDFDDYRGAAGVACHRISTETYR